MGQLSFFTSALDILEEGVAYLHRLELEQAQKKLIEARELDPTLSNVEFYLEIISRLEAWSISGPEPALNLLTVRKGILDEQHRLGGSSVVFQEILKIIARNILRLDDLFDIDGCVTAADPFFHEAECVLRLEQHQQAYLMLLDLVEKRGAKLPARYWGYLGDAAMAYKRRTRAETAYAHLLAIAPDEVDWSTFRHKELREVFEQTARNNPADPALYPLWSFNAWLHDVIHFPKGSTLPQALLTEAKAGEDEIISLARSTRVHRFVLNVFLEDVVDGQPLNREEMRELAPDLFEIFLKKKAGEPVQIF